MAPKEHTQKTEKAPAHRSPAAQTAPPALAAQVSLLPEAALLQRARANPRSLRADELLSLQRSLGNQAVSSLLSRPAAAALPAASTLPSGLIQRQANPIAGDIHRAPPAPRIQREPLFDTWEDCLKEMDATAKKGYSQFVTLQGEAKATPIRDNACRDKKSGKYDKARADSIWTKKAMSDEDFDEALKEKQAADVESVEARLETISHLCDETDGTNRPGSVGDGTSEWALKWEAEHGEPFRSPAGHAYKLRDYCKVIKEGLAEIESKKSSVKSTDTLDQIKDVTTRANDRYQKMRAGLEIWNNRITSFSSVWNSDGTSKLTPPGLDPLARGQLKAGWPKDKTVVIP